MKMNRLGFLSAALLIAACGEASDGGVRGENNGKANNGGNGTQSNDDYDYDDYDGEGQNNGIAYNNGAYAGEDEYYPAPPDGPVVNPQDGENYEEWLENDWIDSATEATSTFSIDVDTASYTLGRSDLLAGRLPAKAGVRVEEYINFFDYGYPQPPADQPFSINMEIAPSPFGDDPTTDEIEHHMLRVGIQGRDVSIEDMKPTNLVFLIDTSGSMSSEDKLPLVQKSLTALVDHLRPSDSVGIVTYAGSAGVLLAPTEVAQSDQILDAINGLGAGGSTNGEGGIVKAYELAEQAKIEGGNNRVIILTDGDFNVGKTGDALVQLVRDYRDKHISLTSVGYGRGNYNDATMEALARDGNGNYFYVDTLGEAERIFGTDLPSTLEVIASDVKIQLEFQSDTVVRYRLVGYENRVLDNDDFDDDTVDAGEIGPGHTVTALYELEIDGDAESATGLLAEVRLRHKAQYGEESQLQEQSIKLSQVKPTIEDATVGFRFATAVTEFAEILRDSKHSEGADFALVTELATPAVDTELETEFLELVDIAAGLYPQP